MKTFLLTLALVALAPLLATAQIKKTINKTSLYSDAVLRQLIRASRLAADRQRSILSRSALGKNDTALIRRQSTLTQNDQKQLDRLSAFAGNRLRMLEEMSEFRADEVQLAISDDELYNLSIRNGTLTDEERSVIQNHASVSIKILSQLPFSKTLKRVPEYAGAHHEKLNGEGYPLGLTVDQLSLKARVMAVADVFEALTASDRPYRKPMRLDKAMEILGYMVKDGELDGRIVDLLESSGVVQAYAEKELRTDQYD